jgi:hypothetical protein
MENKKQLLFLFSVSLALSVAIANERPKGPHGGGPQLTSEQKSCLESKLGPKDSGNRPSRDVMEAAMSACGVERPKGPPPGERQPQSEENQPEVESE